MKDTLNNVIYRLKAVLRILYLTNAEREYKNDKISKKKKKYIKMLYNKQLEKYLYRTIFNSYFILIIFIIFFYLSLTL